MLPVGIQHFSHILVFLPESTNTLRSDFLSPISEKGKLRFSCEGGCVKCRTLPQLEGLLWILSKPKVCKEPRTRKSEGRGGAQARGERGRTSFARHREPADPDRERKPEEARGRGQSRGPASPGPPQRGLSFPLPSPRRAGRGAARAQKTPTSQRAQAHPANSWPRPGPRGGSGQETPGRPGAGADGPGRRPRASGPGGGRFGGRGPGVTRAPGTPRMAEKKSF